MAQTTRAQVQDMIERASRLGDDVLAAEIRAFAAARQFGLVFEHNRPERMRLYGKPVSVGDIVQILPDRGKAEDGFSKLLWKVDAIEGGTAGLSAHRTNSYTDNDREPRQTALANIVAVAEYDQPIFAGLRETGRVERGGDKPYQIVINGENYHALQSLLFCYSGKVDCIYIDPPYNTGARDWKYSNDYVDGNDTYRHSKWLAMMERRLKLAKQLLNPENSVLICTIDEKEYLRLGLLLEQVFSGSNIQMISSVINPAGAVRAGEFTRTNEFVFFVMVGSSTPGEMEKEDQKKETLHWNTLRRTDLSSVRHTRPRQFYPIYVNDNTHKIEAVGDPLLPDESRFDAPQRPGCTAVFPVRPDGTEMNWGITGPELWNRAQKGYVRVGKHEPEQPQQYSLSYLKAGRVKDVESGKARIIEYAKDGSVICEYKAARGLRPTTQWDRKSHDAYRHGTNIISAFLGDKGRFPFPKSLYAVEDALRLFIGDKTDALVVDFFSGSGTTAHAVMRMNHLDKGSRRCICVTNNEVSYDEEKKLIKEGFRHGDPEWEQLGICEQITKPRVKAAITGLTPDGKPIKGDYKFTDEFPMADGFDENAIFFDLTYQNPNAVELGTAFKEIAPLLWLKAGARGTMVSQEERGYAIADTYAILFIYSYVRDFIKAVRSKPSLTCVYIVTDDSARFANVKCELGEIECIRLYESYLRSFRIAAENAVR